MYGAFFSPYWCNEGGYFPLYFSKCDEPGMSKVPTFLVLWIRAKNCWSNSLSRVQDSTWWTCAKDCWSNSPSRDIEASMLAWAACCWSSPNLGILYSTFCSSWFDFNPSKLGRTIFSLQFRFLTLQKCWSRFLQGLFFQVFFPIFSTKMKNRLTRTRATFSRNFHYKKAPR